MIYFRMMSFKPWSILYAHSSCRRTFALCFCLFAEFLYFVYDIYNKYKSQAARQGLAVLMASAVVVLKHVTSTLRQSHNFISIDFKFNVGDYVRKVTSPDKVGLGPMSGQDAT